MSHRRARSPSKISERNAEEYSKLSPADLKAKYDKVYEQFAEYVKTHPGERLPERVVASWFSSKREQLLDEIINMEARIRELDEGAVHAARVKSMENEEERKRNAAMGKGHFTEHELADQRARAFKAYEDYKHDQVYERQRKQNRELGIGPFTNLQVAMQRGTYTEDTAPPGAPTTFIWQRGDRHYMDKGGRTKRAKKAKRSHRHRHLKQRCRTRKH